MMFRRANHATWAPLALCGALALATPACGGDSDGSADNAGNGGSRGGSGGGSKAGSGGSSGPGGSAGAAGGNSAGSAGTGGAGAGGNANGGNAGGPAGPAGGASAGPNLSKPIDSSSWGAPTTITVPSGLMIRPGGTPLLTAPKLAKPLPAGSTISRTMNLLRTSTAQKKNKVTILFYGQSITRQEWYVPVMDYLKQTYPTVDFTFSMLASGGHSAAEMRRVSEHDVMPLYPDLIIYQNYGDYQDVDGIVGDWRSRTTAEVILQNWHLSRYDSEDEYLSHERMSYIYMPDVCTRQGCELQDVRSRFKQAYMAANLGLRSGAYTGDGVHLNGQGTQLMANVVIDTFKNWPTGAVVDPLAMVTDWKVGEGGLDWNGGTLEADFEGNRVDVVAMGAIAAGAADVLIDGKKPSDFSEAYAFTRPNGNGMLIDKPEPGWPWNVGAPFRIDHEAKLVVEDWTLTIMGSSVPFNFTMKGSVTGDDGMGSSGSMFKSRSGRVLIAPSDWTPGLMRAGGGTIVPPTVKWKAIPMFTDKYPAGSTSTSADAATMLIQGISNAKHHLTIKTPDGKPLPIAAIRVYRPGLKR